MALRSNPAAIREPAGVAGPASEPALPFRLSPALAVVIEKCWRQAEAPAAWNLTRQQFEKSLARSVHSRFRDASPDRAAVEAYLASLHFADLALASACSIGSSAAWDYFVAEFRLELYRAAQAIGSANARDLADSVYADLYGLRASEGQRKSLFEYFHGRSKLSTWLRAVLAQRHVDEVRRTRKSESIETEEGRERAEISVLIPQSAESQPGDPDRTQYLAALQIALVAVLGALDPRDRLRLAYYYVDGRTLAEVGRLLHEHEATVSRKLDRMRREIRKSVESELRDTKRWTDAQVRECVEYARGEWPFDLTVSLGSRGATLKPLPKEGAASTQD